MCTSAPPPAVRWSRRHGQSEVAEEQCVRVAPAWSSAAAVAMLIRCHRTRSLLPPRSSARPPLPCSSSLIVAEVCNRVDPHGAEPAVVVRAVPAQGAPHLLRQGQVVRVLQRPLQLSSMDGDGVNFDELEEYHMVVSKTSRSKEE